MDKYSVNDLYMFLQVEVNKFKNDACNHDNLSYHFEKTLNQVDRILKDAFSQCSTSISNFKSLLVELEGKND